MARRRRSRTRKLRGRKAKRLGPLTRVPRFLRLGMSPAAGLFTVLGIGILIGIGVSYHVLELRLERHREVIETQTALSSAVSKHIRKPRPAAAPAALPVLAPPAPLGRSPFAQPRLVQRPDMPIGTDPSGGQAASRFARTIHTPSPSFPERVVLTIPSPPHPTTAAEPAWRRYAVRAEVTEGHPLIAILIDDAGLNRRNTARLVDLRGPLTFAFMTIRIKIIKATLHMRQHAVPMIH